MTSNKRLVKLLLVILGLLIAVASLEIFFRFVEVKDLWGASRMLFGERLRDCLVKDELLHHKLEPNCSGKIKTKDYTIGIKTNSFGFRDTEPVIPKPEGFYRILILGDSFAEGWGVEVENRFDMIARKLLSSLEFPETEKIPPVEIVNTGVRSHSPILHLEYLRNEGLSLNPDMVILLFDMSDLHDDYYYGGWERHRKIKNELNLEAGEYIDEWPQSRRLPTITVLRRSALFSVIYNEVMRRRLNSHKILDTRNLSTDISLFAKAEEWKDFDKVWNLNLANLFLIHDYLASRGIKFAVAVVPRGMYVGSSEWDAGRGVLGIERGVVHKTTPLNIIKGALESRGVVTIDLLKPLRESAKKPLYHNFDGHWTVFGNQVVGEVFANFIFNSLNIDGDI